MGKAAAFEDLALDAFMIIAPGTRLLAAAGSERGLICRGMEIFPRRETEIAWTQVAAEWHGAMGWIPALLVIGHISMAVDRYQDLRRDATLERMAGCRRHHAGIGPQGIDLNLTGAMLIS